MVCGKMYSSDSYVKLFNTSVSLATRVGACGRTRHYFDGLSVVRLLAA